jgi:hypothetical protein
MNKVETFANSCAETVPLDHQPGRVYFLSCDAPDFPIKIGFATGRTARKSSHQTSLPYDVVILAEMVGTRRTERGLLRHFKKQRLRGEWFRRHPELMEVIARVNDGKPPFPPNLELQQHIDAVRARWHMM